MKWKIILGSALAGAVMLGVPRAATAQPAGYPDGSTVNATKHNISWFAAADSLGAGALADYGEVCAYCHTPHGGSTTAKPLWNHTPSVAAYTMYDATWSSTIDMTVAPAPTGVSLACLSCHDGTVGLDAITNVPNSSGASPVGTTLPAGRVTNLGIDLTNDHPISVTYSTAADAAFNPTATVTGAGLELYGASGDQVQCGTCHNPHDNTNRPLLRIANTNSGLCSTCHVK